MKRINCIREARQRALHQLRVLPFSHLQSTIAILTGPHGSPVKLSYYPHFQVGKLRLPWRKNFSRGSGAQIQSLYPVALALSPSPLSSSPTQA